MPTCYQRRRTQSNVYESLPFGSLNVGLRGGGNPHLKTGKEARTAGRPGHTEGRVPHLTPADRAVLG